MSENIYKICAKILCNGYKSTFMEYCVKYMINTRENFTNYFFRTIRLTKHLVDQILADYIGYYMQGSDKYGFSLLPA